ncbi:MAG: SpoIIE family protein phosphatase [Cytophagales bacterium]|nr:SpoIIE family protein phosphatase [Cytophagales bacterium]MDW8383250.1 SpoIIE family protein phosphatase [Flammeovirgaceae bacterium]
METQLLTQQEIKNLFKEIYRKADKLIEKVLWAYVLFSLFWSIFYDTWLIGISVSTICMAFYYFSKYVLPNSTFYQYVSASIQAIFVALFIYQMHGLFEMHFFAFISCTVLIIYQNPFLQIPFISLIVLHHGLFGYLQYIGYREIYFTQLDYMDLQTFIIHGSLAGIISGISGMWAYTLKKNTIERALKLKIIQDKSCILEQLNKELQVREEELKQNLEELNTMQDELISKNRMIEKHINNIRASINYAKRIQEALLPSEDFFKKYLPESFVYYRPKDVVSGDFYFLEEKDNKIYLAVADCTGHGVPGAFMSLIGSESIYHIIKSFSTEQLTSSFILNQLQKKIEGTFLKEEETIKDGMEIGICVIDLQAQTIEFAGAKNSLIYFKNNTIHIVEGDKIGIGYNYNNKISNNLQFNSTQISYRDGDITFYLFSDGYKDQFYHQNGKKLNMSGFKELLINLYENPLEEQPTILDNFLTQWVGKKSLIDDILIVGVKLRARTPLTFQKLELQAIEYKL